jgi:hypothetical protein
MNMRHLLDGLFYLEHTGCQWRPWATGFSLLRQLAQTWSWWTLLLTQLVSKLWQPSSVTVSPWP